MPPVVTLSVGLSGSGKSTRINKKINKLRDAGYTCSVCSADSYFLQEDGSYKFDHTQLGSAHKACQKNFQAALNSKISWIFVDNTNLTPKERSFYLKEAFKAGALVFLNVHPTDVDLSEARNIHGVPRATLERMANKIDFKRPGVYSVLQAANGEYEYHFEGMWKEDDE